MGNRDDEYYDREDRRPSQRSSRDDDYRGSRRSDDRYRNDYYEDDYDDYDDRPRRKSSESSRNAS